METEYQFHLTDDDLPPEALDDPMKPPQVPTLVHCIHCGEEYDSWRMIWVPFTEEQMKSQHPCTMKGFWRWPIEGCTGAGFTVDIWPVDPEYRDPKTGEKYWFEDEPLIEGHEPDCDCVDCEMAQHEQDAELGREMAEYERKVERGEVPFPQSPTDEDIPF